MWGPSHVRAPLPPCAKESVQGALFNKKKYDETFCTLNFIWMFCAINPFENPTAIFLLITIQFFRYLVNSNICHVHLSKIRIAHVCVL